MSRKTKQHYVYIITHGADIKAVSTSAKDARKLRDDMMHKTPPIQADDEELWDYMTRYNKWAQAWRLTKWPTYSAGATQPEPEPAPGECAPQPKPDSRAQCRTCQHISRGGSPWCTRRLMDVAGMAEEAEGCPDYTPAT